MGLVCRKRIWASAIALAVATALLPAGASGESLTEQAHRLAGEHLRRMGSGYSASIDEQRRIVYVSALDSAHLEQTATLLALWADAMEKAMGWPRPAWNVTVLLPTNADYARLTPSKHAAGFYVPKDRTLTSIDRGDVLIHEFIHALHHADQAASGHPHPIWISEGLATLFSHARLDDTGLHPLPASRLASLRKALADNKTFSLRQLLDMEPEEFVKNSQVCYAQARHLLLYLHTQGKLREFYGVYRETYDDDPTGALALEKVFRTKLYVIEEDWKKWALSLEDPAEDAALQASLGVQVQDVRGGGVRVAALQAGKAAATADRLAPGDVIVSFNGRRVENWVDLTRLVASTGANQTVSIQVLRAGQSLTIRQPLGAAAR